MRRGRRTMRAGFTLIELLVVIGIIALLGALTVFSIASIFKDAKLSSGTNTVIAALDNARALALKNNRLTMVVFRSQREGEKDNVVEIITAEWTGETYHDGPIADRFVPVKGMMVRQLPVGIKVAAPFYAATGGDADSTWITQSHLPAIQNGSGLSGGPLSNLSEWPGPLLAVMYNGRGEVITTNAETDSVRALVDFQSDYHLPGGGINQDNDTLQYDSGLMDYVYFYQLRENDESFVTHAPFLAVYDDDAARDQYDTTQWRRGAGTSETDNQRLTDLSSFITAQANRIHFNRYTGVVMK